MRKIKENATIESFDRYYLEAFVKPYFTQLGDARIYKHDREFFLRVVRAIDNSGSLIKSASRLNQYFAAMDFGYEITISSDHNKYGPDGELNPHIFQRYWQVRKI